MIGLPVILFIVKPAETFFTTQGLLITTIIIVTVIINNIEDINMRLRSTFSKINVIAILDNIYYNVWYVLCVE